MDSDRVAKIVANPKFQRLVKTRSAFGWKLTGLMMLTYYGYIAVIAFDKERLSVRLGGGVTTLGIPIGFGVIVFTVLLTGLYVRRANAEFDALTAEIVDENER